MGSMRTGLRLVLLSILSLPVLAGCAGASATTQVVTPAGASSAEAERAWMAANEPAARRCEQAASGAEEALRSALAVSHPPRTTVDGAAVAATTSLHLCMDVATAATQELAAMTHAGQTPTPGIFTVYGRILGADARGRQVAAASMALEAAIGSSRSEAAFDTLAEGARSSLRAPVLVSDDQARRAFEAAADELVAACRAKLEDAYRANPALPLPAADACGPHDDGAPRASRPPRAQGVTEAMAGSGAADDDRALVPDRWSEAPAAACVDALRRNDTRTALERARDLAPRGPLATAIGRALSML
jgi:hypothetical protein